jgi:CSLREA domain-containing protein
MNISSNLFIRRAIRFVAGLLINAGALAASASIASAAVITVTTGLDEFDTTPNATCSLREAIQSANTDSDFGGCTSSGIYGNDTIVFTVPLVQLTITTGLTSNDDNSFLDLDIVDTSPVLPDNLTIDGGPSSVTIQPGISPWTDRIFDIVPNPTGQPATVILRNLIIQGGGPPNNETGSFPCINGGGGVRNWSNGRADAGERDHPEQHHAHERRRGVSPGRRRIDGAEQHNPRQRGQPTWAAAAASSTEANWRADSCKAARC